MKSHKSAGEKKTSGTTRAAELRARCNKLTEAERRKLRDEAMRLYYDSEPEPTGARRR